jgi:hypothetical protein
VSFECDLSGGKRNWYLRFLPIFNWTLLSAFFRWYRLEELA